MNIQQMKYFLAVARTEHMTKSAEMLHVAQPALSRSIAQLERELDVALFERKNRRMRLTPEGRLLQERLTKIVRQIDDLPSELAALQDQRRSTVRIQVSAATHLAVEAISTWMASKPDAHIELVQNERPDDDVDIVIDSHATNACVEKRCFSERIMLAVPTESDLGDGPLTLDMLASYSFVSPAGSFGFRRICDNICREHGFTPAVSLESDNAAAVREIIALNLGVGFWPEHSWGKPEGSAVHLVEIAESGFERHIHVSLLAPHAENPYATGFYNHLCAHIERVFAD